MTKRDDIIRARELAATLVKEAPRTMPPGIFATACLMAAAATIALEKRDIEAARRAAHQLLDSTIVEVAGKLRRNGQ